MAAANALVSVPTKDKWDRTNEEAHRQQMVSELVQKWDKRGNLIVQNGKTLGFTDPNTGETVTFGFDTDGNFTFQLGTDPATAVGTSADVIAEAAIRFAADSAEASTRAAVDAAFTTSLGVTNANASNEVTARTTADSAEATTRAANDATITTAAGVTNANVTAISQAYATNSGSTARILWKVATGTNVATIEQSAHTGYSDGTWNGSAIALTASLISLLAQDINFGTNTHFEATYGTIYTVSGSYRCRTLGAFPASGDLLLWYGLNSVALNSETKANSLFALGTDGVVYYGGTGLAASLTLSISPKPANGSRLTAGNIATNVTATVAGGSGSYTYQWKLSDHVGGKTTILTSATSATCVITTNVSVSGDESSGVLTCYVLDSAGNTAVLPINYDHVFP